MRRKSLMLICLFIISSAAAFGQIPRKIASGVWKITYGNPEQNRPTDFKEEPNTAALDKLGEAGNLNDLINSITFTKSPQGIIIAEMPMSGDERFFGFGLQVNEVDQTGMRRDIRSNSKTVGNVGFAHAPMPFFISSKGYGVLVNTARYTTFYMGSQRKIDKSGIKNEVKAGNRQIATSEAELYKKQDNSNGIQIVVRGTEGMEILIFEGPSMKEVMQRYNLYSGGGGLPPMWSLGFKYRAKGTFDQEQIIKMANYFRDNDIPCDMLGVEPGWHTHAYSCSFVWNPAKFPAPDAFLDKVQGMNYKLNMWEHAYTHPTAPFYKDILPYSGNFEVWRGAVPDFITPEAKEIFGSYHENELVKKGVASFKLDECDAADYNDAHAEWSFPDIAEFPSGVDGEQMRQLLGLLYQKTLLDIYTKNNMRTMHEVRASYLFASPYTSVIYSDLYNNADYVKMIINSGFSGVNWSPELRDSKGEADLIRRMQMTMMSSHMDANCWYLDLPPWLQYNRQKNQKGELLPNHKELEALAKKVVETRMSLIPYLYGEFAKYHYEGIPVFRGLAMDFPNDEKAYKIEDQYMMGDIIMCAPFLDGAMEREIYFPAGVWYDFNTNKKYEGGKSYKIAMGLDEAPMFVRDNSILPLAVPLQYVDRNSVFELTCNVYGSPKVNARLFEDDTFNLDYRNGAYNWVDLNWNGKKVSVSKNGKYKGDSYRLKDFKLIN